MKIVLVISSISTGGAERVLATLANSWAARGWDVTLVTTHDPGEPPFYFVDPAVQLKPILLSEIAGGGNWSNLKRTIALRSILRELSPDLVVSFLNYTNILTLLASLGSAFPVVISERLDPRIHRLTGTWGILRRLLYPFAAGLVNQTEDAAEWFRGWMGQKVTVVPNPVLAPQFDSSSPEVQLTSPAIVAMGRLHPQKGFETLLTAMRRVHDVAPEIELTILGEGPLRPVLEAYRAQLGLEHVVKMPGNVQRPQNILREADLFVLSSITEGFPNVLCEAMAVGLPVVSTDCPSGPRDIVHSGKNGLLVPVGEPEAIAEAILSLMNNPLQRKSMGIAAQLVVDRYSIANILAQWDSVFTEVGAIPGE
jgi:GalNAc-alpha-(1->4)-GalNAc-alpha-(1->3)-diNAcBac-PP-undecaprenol alpha-1,4-N-acetyl-D-galactosaminyltransferase